MSEDHCKHCKIATIPTGIKGQLCEDCFERLNEEYLANFTKPDWYLCEFCGERFKTVKERGNHIIKVHAEE